MKQVVLSMGLAIVAVAVLGLIGGPPLVVGALCVPLGLLLAAVSVTNDRASPARRRAISFITFVVAVTAMFALVVVRGSALGLPVTPSILLTGVHGEGVLGLLGVIVGGGFACLLPARVRR
jgi:hypothetical protein